MTEVPLQISEDRFGLLTKGPWDMAGGGEGEAL